jgi:hypothetical protein
MPRKVRIQRLSFKFRNHIGWRITAILILSLLLERVAVTCTVNIRQGSRV